MIKFSFTNGGLYLLLLLLLLLLLWRYIPLCAFTSLMILLHRYLSCAVLHYVVTFRILRSFNTESNHFSLGLPFFVLHSDREKFIFLQGALSSILAIFHSHLNVAVLIIFTMLGSLYKLYNSSLCFILHTSLTQIGP
jgi:hypothetical protein